MLVKLTGSFPDDNRRINNNSEQYQFNKIPTNYQLGTLIRVIWSKRTSNRKTTLYDIVRLFEMLKKKICIYIYRLLIYTGNITYINTGLKNIYFFFVVPLNHRLKKRVVWPSVILLRTDRKKNTFVTILSLFPVSFWLRN